MWGILNFNIFRYDIIFKVAKITSLFLLGVNDFRKEFVLPLRLSVCLCIEVEDLPSELLLNKIIKESGEVMPDTLNYEDIREFLTTKYIGRKVLYLESAASTNDIAKELTLKGEEEGLIVIAEEQTKGRGRMGRKWSTGKGMAIAATVLLKPNIQPKYAPSITPVLALSITQAIKELTDIDVKIKWPNDIVLNNRKLSGILTEMKAEGEKINYVIAGMGLNVNQDYFEEEIRDIAISLKMYLKQSQNRGKILASILNKFEINYEVFKASGISPLIGQLKKASILMGRKVTITNLKEKYDAFILDMDSDGSLIGRLDNGKIIKILSGEISVTGVYGCKD